MHDCGIYVISTPHSSPTPPRPPTPSQLHFLRTIICETKQTRTSMRPQHERWEESGGLGSEVLVMENSLLFIIDEKLIK